MSDSDGHATQIGRPWFGTSHLVQAGVTTKFLVDTQSPTGYAQVVYETFSGSTALNRELSHVYSYGLELVNEARSYLANGQSANATFYFDYDGASTHEKLTP